MDFKDFFIEKWYDNRGTTGWTVNKAYDKTKIEKTKYDYYDEKYDAEIGSVIFDEYEYNETLPDNNELYIRVVGSHYDDYGEDWDMAYLDEYYDVYVEAYYGKPRDPNKRITARSSSEEKRDQTIKTQPYSTYVPYQQELLNKRKKEREATIQKYKDEGKEVPEHLLEPDYYEIPIAPYSHAKVANRIVSLVTSLLKEVTKDYSVLIIDFETEQHMKTMRSLVNKVADKMGAAPTTIDIDELYVMKNDFNWAYNDHFLAYDLPKHRIEKEFKDQQPDIPEDVF